jgi:hypothetical protein
MTSFNLDDKKTSLHDCVVAMIFMILQLIYFSLSIVHNCLY